MICVTRCDRALRTQCDASVKTAVSKPSMLNHCSLRFSLAKGSQISAAVGCEGPRVAFELNVARIIFYMKRERRSVSDSVSAPQVVASRLLVPGRPGASILNRGGDRAELANMSGGIEAENRPSETLEWPVKVNQYGSRAPIMDAP